MKDRLKLPWASYFLIFILTSFQTRGYSQEIDYSLVPQTKITYDELREGFQSVPDAYKLRNFWLWLNGIATKESVTQDLEAMKSKGFGGAIITDNGAPFKAAGPVFMSREWLELFAHAIKAADHLGMELSVNIQSGLGDPGNPHIQSDNGLKKIVFSEIRVTGPGKIEVRLPQPPSQIYYQDLAVQAFKSHPTNWNQAGIRNWDIKTLNKEVPWSEAADRYVMELFAEDTPKETTIPATSIDPRQIIDLNGRFSEGTLKWDVPEGEWTIIRYGMTSTGKRNDYGSPGYKGGLCYDQINRKGVEAQWHDVAEPLLEVARQSGNSLKFVHTDSWEIGLTNWTQGFKEAFAKRRGYDLTPYLPVLTNKVVGSGEISDRFLEDFRLTIGELVADENYTLLSELTHASGVLLHSESGGPHAAPIDGLQTLGRNDIPMGEFWGRSATHRTTEGRRLVVKQGSSAAHIYGKRFFSAEGPTTVGPLWERSPRDLKGLFDQVFCDGVNRVYWHTWSSSPDAYGLPGVAYFAGTHLNRQITWWKESEAFIGYLNRCQFLLSQGLYRADVLNYYGTGVPKYVFLDTDVRVPEGYAWDMCNSEVLLTRASIKAGRIVLPDGMSYALLSLSDQESISLPVLKKIEEMVREGMILVGNPPTRAYGLSGYPGSDEELKAIVKRLWGGTGFVNTYGKGKVYKEKTIAEVLALGGITPDFSYTAGPDVALDYIHRSTADMEIYYVANKWSRKGEPNLKYRYHSDLPDCYISATYSFRVDGEREVERWDPVSGEMTPVKVYRHEQGCYRIPVSLAPEGSAFFVFRKSKENTHLAGIEKDGKPVSEGNDPLVWGASAVFVKDGQAEILGKGRYRFTGSNGRQTTVDVLEDRGEQMISGLWKVRFMENPALGEEVTTTMDSLRSWTTFLDRKIRYFSGTARYTNSFVLPGEPNKRRVYLDLGNVQELATIKVNGKEVRTCWIAPYRVDITAYVKEGENLLEVDVTNLWCNRLIGDGKLPKEERRTCTTVTKFDAPDAEQYLRVSGLLGPVKLQFSQIRKLNDTNTNK